MKAHKYAVIIEKAIVGFSAYLPDLPGCVATGKTKQQVRRRIHGAVSFHLKSMLEDGDQIPKPTSECDYLDVQLAS